MKIESTVMEYVTLKIPMPKAMQISDAINVAFESLPKDSAHGKHLLDLDKAINRG